MYTQRGSETAINVHGYYMESVIEIQMSLLLFIIIFCLKRFPTSRSLYLSFCTSNVNDSVSFL